MLGRQNCNLKLIQYLKNVVKHFIHQTYCQRADLIRYPIFWVALYHKNPISCCTRTVGLRISTPRRNQDTFLHHSSHVKGLVIYTGMQFGIVVTTITNTLTILINDMQQMKLTSLSWVGISNIHNSFLKKQAF